MSTDESRLPTTRPRVVGLPLVREDALQRLNDAYANNLLELDELEQRLAAVQHARTLDEVEAQLADLPVVAGPPESETIRSHMGSKTIVGPQLAARRVEAQVSLGTLKLDYRHTDLPEVIELDLDVHLSTCKLWLPDDCVLENRLDESLSTVKSAPRPPDVPVRTTLRLTGKVHLGTVKVYYGGFWGRLFPKR